MRRFSGSQVSDNPRFDLMLRFWAASRPAAAWNCVGAPLCSRIAFSL
jgi:hypothetical protein